MHVLLTSFTIFRKRRGAHRPRTSVLQGRWQSLFDQAEVHSDHVQLLQLWHWLRAGHERLFVPDIDRHARRERRVLVLQGLDGHCCKCQQLVHWTEIFAKFWTYIQLFFFVQVELGNTNRDIYSKEISTKTKLPFKNNLIWSEAYYRNSIRNSTNTSVRTTGLLYIIS